jgi:drug/metabolite transporter (DMT)-like permease
VAGSWIGFSAYSWLLRASTPSRVATYAYVNPVIAVLLGWLLLGEKLTPQMFWGAAVIIAGVAIILAPTWNPPRRSRAVRASLKD